jgi:radical SAM protein with 4Fe4S-binding SPASM domain
MRELLAAIRPYPRTCVWELTPRCNLRCLHCASSLGPRATRAGGAIDGRRALRLCGELAELGCEYVALSGGEPLLREDWPRVAARLAELGVGVGVISNGLLVDDRAVREMVRAGVSILAISIDGPPAVHDAIRRRPGCHRRAIEALERARDAGLRIHAVTHLNRLNVPHLDELHAALAALRVRTWLVQLSAPMGRMRDHPELVLAPEDVPSIASWLAVVKPRSSMYVAVGDNIGYYGALEPVLRRRRPDERQPFWCGCSAGILTVGIESNGNVKGCLSLQSDRFVEGNVLDRPLREIWEDERAFAYTRRFKPAMLRGACRGCEYGELCRGGCTFMSVGATGEPGGDPYCLHRLGCA